MQWGCTGDDPTHSIPTPIASTTFALELESRVTIDLAQLGQLVLSLPLGARGYPILEHKGAKIEV